MRHPARALKVGAIRGLVLGGVLGLVAGPFGLALGLVATPLSLLELRARETYRSSLPFGYLLLWASLFWVLALVGCFLAYGQGVYAHAAWQSGPASGVQALLAEVERVQGTEAQSLRLYLLCGALAYSGASLARLQARVRDFLWLGLITGVAGTLLSPLAAHGTWLDQLGASLMLVPCLAAGALPLWSALWVFYAAVDRGVEAWDLSASRGSAPASAGSA